LHFVFILETLSPEKTSLAVPVAERAALPLILGQQDQTRRLIERELQVDIALRDTTFLVSSAQEDNARRAVSVLDQIIGIAQNSLRGGRDLQPEDVQRLVAQAKNGDAPAAVASVAQTGRAFGDTILVSERGKPIGPRTAGQKHYLEAVRRADLTFVIGPAGTVKTYLSVAVAVAAF
jgi:phosphate starvation-inducible PhoH-like protein